MANEKGFNFYDFPQILDHGLYPDNNPRIHDQLDMCFRIATKKIELVMQFTYVNEKTIIVEKKFNIATIYEVEDINKNIKLLRFINGENANEYIVKNDVKINPDDIIRIHIPDSTIVYEFVDNYIFKLTYEDGYIVNFPVSRNANDYFNPNGSDREKYRRFVKYGDITSKMNDAQADGYTMMNHYTINERFVKPMMLFNGDSFRIRLNSENGNYSTVTDITIHHNNSIMLSTRTFTANSSNNVTDSYCGIYGYIREYRINFQDGSPNNNYNDLLIRDKVIYDNIIDNVYEFIGSLSNGNSQHMEHDNKMYYVNSHEYHRFNGYRAINV